MSDPTGVRNETLKHGTSKNKMETIFKDQLQRKEF